MLCNFDQIEPGLHRCRHCGREVQSQMRSDRIHAACRSPLTASQSHSLKPSLAQRAINFTVAAIAHAVRGAPTCSQEEIDARRAICQACPLFDGSICRHADCGCRISQQKKFFNKLAWADQSCPLGKWPAVTMQNHE